MKKLLLVLVFVAGCSPACHMSTVDCHNMCYPRQVDRFDDKGCFCVDGKVPSEKVAEAK